VTGAFDPSTTSGLIEFLVVVGAVLVVAILALRFISRDPKVKAARLGFFIERERFNDDDQAPSADDPTEIIPPYDR
jgi:hypothetical protein